MVSRWANELDFYPERHWFRYVEEGGRWSHEKMDSACPNYVAISHSEETGPKATLQYTIRGDGLQQETRFRLIRTDRCFQARDIMVKENTSIYYWFDGCEYASPTDRITIAFQTWNRDQGRFVPCEPKRIETRSAHAVVELLFAAPAPEKTEL